VPSPCTSRPDTCEYVCLCVCVSVRMRGYVSECVYKYVHEYTYIYIYTTSPGLFPQPPRTSVGVDMIPCAPRPCYLYTCCLFILILAVCMCAGGRRGSPLSPLLAWLLEERAGEMKIVWCLDGLSAMSRPTTWALTCHPPFAHTASPFDTRVACSDCSE